MITFLTAIGAWKYIIGIIGIIATLLMARKSGADSVKNKHKEKLLDDIHKTKVARFNLDDDPNYADSVRKRFTRK